jgi:hypothetical protein
MIWKRDPPARTPPKEPWHAVSVVPGQLACPSARSAKGRRFLAAEAPQIPLPDCESTWRCKCTYRHHPDRRAGPRRAVELGSFNRFDGIDQRRLAGRRAEDAPNKR